MRSIWMIPAIAAFALLSSNPGLSQENFGQPISGRPIDFGTATPPESKPVTDSSLRQQYLELAKTRAELMTEATLKEEIATTQKNIRELRALQKLHEAQELLLSLTTEFPDSEAAAKAKRMLDALQAIGPRASFTDELGPALNTASDERFQRSSNSRELPRVRQPDFEASPSSQSPIDRPPTRRSSSETQNQQPRTKTPAFPKI